MPWAVPLSGWFMWQITMEPPGAAVTVLRTCQGLKVAPPVAVDGEAHEAIGHSGDNPCRHVVAVGRAGPEQARRDAQEPPELGLVRGYLVVDLTGVLRAADAVGGPSGDGQGQVPGAVVGDLEQRLPGQLAEGGRVGVDPAGVKEQRRWRLPPAQEADQSLVVAAARQGHRRRPKVTAITRREVCRSRTTRGPPKTPGCSA